MNNRFRLASAAVAVAIGASVLFGFLPQADAGQVYDDVYAELTRHANRLPGSPGFLSSVAAIERKLSDAGLTPRRMTFNSLAPSTQTCEFKVDGRIVENVFPLGPNGFALNTSGHAELSGSLVWLGDGTPEDMEGKAIAGSIAMMRFGSQNMHLAFLQGAKAVVFVGDGKETQWEVSAQFTEMPASIPRLFIGKDDADKAGLFEKAASKAQASVSVRTKWEDVQSVNLWVEIPGEEGKCFNFKGCEEALIFGAVLDTFGAVPEVCPQNRAAANCALLAELACELSKSGFIPKRSVYFVFFGGQYSAQEGARNFYFAMDKIDEGGNNNDHLLFRQESYQDELKSIKGQIQILSQEGNEILDTSDPALTPYLRTVEDKLTKRLDGWVNNLNFEIQQTILEQSRTPSEELKEREKKLGAEKKSWNELRRELLKGNIKSKEAFKSLVDDISSDLLEQQAEVERMIQNNDSFIEFGKTIRGKVMVGHLDLDFASDSSPWVLNMFGDCRISREPGLEKNDIKVGSYMKSLSGFGEILTAMDTSGWTAKPFLDAVKGKYYPAALAIPLERSMPSNIAISMGCYGYQMMSVGSRLDGDELPYREDVSLSRLLPMLVDCVKAFSESELLSIQGPMVKPDKYKPATYYYNMGDYVGDRYMGFSKGSASDLEGVPKNSIAAAVGEMFKGQLTFQRTPICGHSRIAFAKINKVGYTFIPCVVKSVPEDKRRVGAFGFDSYGIIDRYPAPSRPDRLFYSYGGSLFIPFDPTGRITTSNILNARNNSPFRSEASYKGKEMVSLHYDKPYDFKWLSDGLTLIGSEPNFPLGYGFSYDPFYMLSLNTIRHVASDYSILNQSRLDVLRKKNIINDSIETLQADAGEHLSAAKEAREKLSSNLASAHETFACALGYRVCKPLRDIANDMVQAVIVLLLLSIPFSFFMERLLFGFTSIYKQVGGFAMVFILTFILLYIIHPAFSLASAPVVIFLAFVIVLMSSIVIYIVMSKFKLELKAIQGLASTVHGASSESSTALASVLIGISGMRNRPLKTFLTATTVILLTFTILVFASFSSSIGVSETYLGKGQGPDRIEIHRFTFLNMPKHLVSAIKTMYSKDWDIFERGCCFRDPTMYDPDTGNVIVNPKTGKTFTLGGLLGFDLGELARNPDLRQAIPLPMAEGSVPTDASTSIPPIMLPESIAPLLMLSEGDKVLVAGKEYVYRGNFTASAVDGLASLDGTKLLPPDFDSMQQQDPDNKASNITAQESSGGIDMSSFTFFSPQQCAITTFEGLPSETATNNFLCLYPKKDASIGSTAKEIAQVFLGPVYAKGMDGTRQYFFTKEMKASGFSEVIVPLLLGGLIIFSSLLGSIVERSKEIFTYSALGLAPPDVGALFFAESSVYAVLGGMGGYLLSQLVSFILYFLASRGLFHPPEMNFSSLSSVLTILIVMATVILSTIYPALKASKSANPGVARKWRMPRPDGRKLKFTFPFTVSATDMGGILCFIKEHFDNHGDASLGNFASNGTIIFKDGEASSSYGISSAISLAPFDLGVFQNFKMYSMPSEIEGIDEIVVEIERVNGTEGAWLRGNRAFVDELRNQFLLWRSLPLETIVHYKTEGADIHAANS